MGDSYEKMNRQYLFKITKLLKMRIIQGIKSISIAHLGETSVLPRKIFLE